MKSTTVKSALFAALVLTSLSCFIYVNTTPIDRTLQVETTVKSSVENAEEVTQNAQMLDLILFKGAVSLVKTFFPAK